MMGRWQYVTDEEEAGLRGMLRNLSPELADLLVNDHCGMLNGFRRSRARIVHAIVRGEPIPESPGIRKLHVTNSEV